MAQNHDLSSFYEKLQQTQNGLLSEMTFSKFLDEHSLQHFINEFGQNYKNYLISDKQHYAKILMMILNFGNQDRKLPINFIDSFGNPIQPENNNVNTLNHQEILGYINKMNDKQSLLIDIISYSTIPSIFSMLLEEKSANLFNKFIKQIENQKLKFKLSRFLFVSPLFLNFSYQIFHSIIRQLFLTKTDFNEEKFFSNSTISNFQSSILQSFKNNFKCLPKYIFLFLKEMGSDHKIISDILKNNYFNPLIENPALFMVYDPSIIDDELNQKFLSKFLKTVLSNDFIDQISELFQTNEFYYNCFLNPKYIKIYQNNFSLQTIIDSIDDQMLKALKDPSKQPVSFNINVHEYNLYQCDIIIQDDDYFNDNIEDQFFGLSQSILPKNDNWGYFRKLIKEAPPLPNEYFPFQHDEQNSEEFDEKTVIENSLVQKYNPFRSIKDYLNFSKVEKINFSDDDIDKNLDQMIVKHTEVEKSISEIRELISDIEVIGGKKKKMVKKASELFNTFMTQFIQPDESIIKRASEFDLDKIMANSDDFFILFEDYYSNCIEKVKLLINNEDCSYIFANRFFQKFKFSSFLLKRNDLYQYDKNLRSFFARNFIKINNYTRSSPDDIIRKISSDLKMIENEAKELNLIFTEDCNPVMKFRKFFEFVNDFLPKYSKRESDNVFFYYFYFTLFSFANPPNLLSNIAFMFDFVLYQLKYPKKGLFYHEDAVRPFLETVQPLLDFMKEANVFTLKPKMLFRNSNKFFFFVVTGDDTKNIAETCKSIAEHFKFNSVDLNSFTKRISHGDDPEITFDSDDSISTYMLNMKIKIKAFKKFNLKGFKFDKKFFYYGFYYRSDSKPETVDFSGFDKKYVISMNYNKNDLQKLSQDTKFIFPKNLNGELCYINNNCCPKREKII